MRLREKEPARRNEVLVIRKEERERKKKDEAGGVVVVVRLRPPKFSGPAIEKARSRQEPPVLLLLARAVRLRGRLRHSDFLFTP